MPLTATTKYMVRTPKEEAAPSHFVMTTLSSAFPSALCTVMPSFASVKATSIKWNGGRSEPNLVPCGCTVAVQWDGGESGSGWSSGGAGPAGDILLRRDVSIRDIARRLCGGTRMLARAVYVYMVLKRDTVTAPSVATCE